MMCCRSLQDNYSCQRMCYLSLPFCKGVKHWGCLFIVGLMSGSQIMTL